MYYDGMLTILDIAKMQGSDQMVGLIEESIMVNPEIERFPARTITGTTFHTTVRTGYPVAQFRYANEGVVPSKSTFEQRLSQCNIIDARVAADMALARVWEPGGVAGWQMVEAAGVLEGIHRLISRQIYYGNSPEAVAAALGDKKGFPGFIDSYDTAFEVDAGGATNGTENITSVWAVKLGLKDVHLIAGGGGNLDFAAPEWRLADVLDANGRAFLASVNNFMGWMGMGVGSKHSLARIKNVGTTANHMMSDSLGQQALELFPSGVLPDFFLMTRRSRRQLQNSRTPTGNNPINANSVPTPTEIEGIPIIVTDAIVNNEQILLA